MHSFATHPQPNASRRSDRRFSQVRRTPPGHWLPFLTGSIAVSGLAASALPGAARAQSPYNVLSGQTRTFTNIESIPGITNLVSQSYPLVGCFSTTSCLSDPITIPFPFRYFGQTETTVRVDVHGWFAFGSGASFSTSGNTIIPSTNSPNNAIFAWHDFHFGINLRRGLLGTAPNRRFIIELEFRPGSSGGGSGRIQLWLYENPPDGWDNTFEVYYGGDVTGFSSASVGVENAAGGGFPVFTCTPSCSITQYQSLVNTGWRLGPPDIAELFPTFPEDGLPRGAFPGTSAQGVVEITNVGLSTATQVLTDVWLSQDATFDETVDIRVGTTTIASAPFGASTASVTLDIPPSLPVGDYVVFVRADVGNGTPELLETNNVAEADQRFATAYELAGADCRVTNPRGVNPGQTLTFEIDLVNNGVPYAGPLEVSLRASLDSNFDGNDPVIGTVPVTFTGANRETGQGAFTLAAGSLSPGRYFPICQVDPNNLVTESIETNNIVVGRTQFGSGPDFSVSSITMPREVRPGGSVTIDTTIQNLAVPTSASVEYRLFASLDDTLDANDINLGGSQRFTATFAGEDEITDSRTITFSASIPGGRYRIIAELDPGPSGGRIPEVDETNNIGVSATEIVNAIDFQALRATVAAAPPTPTLVGGIQAGDRIQITGTAESTGLSFVGNVPFGIYFSENTTYESTDPEVYRGLIFFPGNTSGSVDLSFRVPPVRPAGYNVLFVINPDNNPVEAARENNTVVATGAGTLLTVQGADLRVESITAPPVAFIGRTMEVSIEVRNDSQVADARGFRYAYYLSEDEFIRVFDQQIYVSGTATVAAGETETFTDLVPIPASFTSSQTLFLGVIADIFSAVPETNDNNNTRRVPNPIGFVFPIPDLSGTVVATATAAGAGEQLAVTRLIENSGVADATDFEYTYYLSTNQAIAPDDIPIGTFRRTLPLGTDDYAIDIIDVPATVTEGDYFLGLILDPANRVQEVQEDNNTALGPRLRVYAAALIFLTQRLKGGTVGVDYAEGVFAQGGPTPITWSVTQGQLPPGLMLDTQGGLISGRPTQEGLYTFTLRATSGTAFAEREFSVRITSPTIPLTLATLTLRSAVVGRRYSENIIAVGGVPPYIFDSPTLPPGLTLTSSGTLEGTPAAPGAFMFDVTVNDDLGARASGLVSLNVVNPGSSILQITPPMVEPVVGVELCPSMDNPTTQFNARNGIPPYTWSVSGRLPAGVTLSSEGALCGTPEEPGVFDVTVRAQDTTGLYDTILFRLNVRDADDCSIASFNLPNGTLGEPYTLLRGGERRPVQLLATEGCDPPIEWGLVERGGDLPPGLTFSTTGTISGTPTAPGAYAFLLQVSDALGDVDVQPFSIVIADVPEVVPEPDDGCTCAAPGDRGTPVGWMVLLVPALALVVRRRR